MTKPEETEIIVPLEIQAIFNQADNNGPYAAKILPDAVQLTSADGKTIYKEVKWADAQRWSRNALAIIARNTQK